MLITLYAFFRCLIEIHAIWWTLGRRLGLEEKNGALDKIIGGQDRSSRPGGAGKGNSGTNNSVSREKGVH